MGILDDVLKTTPAQEFLDQQSPAVRDALAEGLGLPDDPRITGYRPFQPPVPGVPGKAPEPWAPRRHCQDLCEQRAADESRRRRRRATSRGSGSSPIRRSTARPCRGWAAS